MPPRTIPLDEFLDQYKSLLNSIAEVAQSADIDGSTLITALLSRPFSLPPVLKNEAGAAPVSEELRRLRKDHDRVDADVTTIDEKISALVREVFAGGAASGKGLKHKGKPLIFGGRSRGVRASAIRPMSAGNGGDHDVEAIESGNGDGEGTAKSEREMVPGLLGDETADVEGRKSSAEPPEPAPPFAPAPPASPPPPPPPPPPPAPGEPADAESPAEGPPSDVTTPRWINAEIEDHDKDEPLALGETYTIAFGVDVVKKATAIAATTFDDNLVFPSGVEEAELTVQLNSDDFDISEQTRPLRLGRTGKSRGKARFEITPKHEGRCTLKATFHKEGNFVQQMEISISVGAAGAKPVTSTAIGRPPAAATVLQPRDLLLIMKPAAVGGYDFTAASTGFKSVRLPIEPAQLTAAIAAVRDALLQVVQQTDSSGSPPFQAKIDIADADRDVALKTMARAGARLFQVLFDHPAAGSDVQGIGTWLRELTSKADAPMKIQIVAEAAPIPWPMLYMGDASSKATLDWDHFLGMRHIIEQLPMQNELSYGDSSIASDQPELRVSINVNSKIDVQMHADFVGRQQKFWDDAVVARRHMKVTGRTLRDELVAALADSETEDQIFYFYGHAVAAGLGTPGGPDASHLVLSDAKLTLGDLNLDAPTTVQMRGNPLVFINACESAQMSPLFYDGFVPYFMAKGARGVIGTECKTPAIFAATWAQRFFTRFLDGEPLGELFLALRREFLDQHGNPLGLLYAVHCDGDTQVSPALTTTN